MPSVMCEPLQAVTFDVGNTILFPYPSVGTHYAAVAAKHGLRMSEPDAERRFFDAWRTAAATHPEALLYGRTHNDARRFWGRIMTLSLAEWQPTNTTIEAIVEELYGVFSHAVAWRVDSAWPGVLRACRERGLRVGLVSNWDLRLRQLLQELELVGLVDSTVISAEHGCEKPDAAIFAIATDELGVEPARSLHLGDGWREDVCGAAAAGMQCAWFNPAGVALPGPAPAGCRVVRALPELTALL